MNELQWKGDYSMEDFVNNFCKRTPVLAKTLTGTLGCDELHVLSKDEIYWIKSLKKQKRIVVIVKSKDKYLSIPIKYPVQFELSFDAITSRKNVPIKLLTEIMKDVDFSTGKKYFIRAVQDQLLPFQIGSHNGAKARFGFMEIMDTYEEKYFLGYPVCNNQIHSNVFAIPVYLNIHLTVATSFCNYHQESFNDWFKQVDEIVSSFPEEDVAMCEEIILFNKRPADTMYEYIDLRTLFMDEKSKNSLADSTNEIVQNHKRSDCTWQGPVKSVRLPHIPVSQPSVSAKGNVRSRSYKINIKSNPAIDSTLKYQDRSTSEICPSSNTYECIKHEQIFPELTDNSYYEELIKRGQLAQGQKKFINMPKCPDVILPKPDPGKMVKEKKAIPVCTLSIHEISTADLRSFRVRDIEKCLKLLKLEKYCQLFEKLQIDGELLMAMDETILVEECHFTKFEAMKLTKFAKHGWRPNQL